MVAGRCAALGLEKRFANSHAMLCLHVWLALVRLRAEGRDGKDLAQMVYEDFQEDVERRVHAEGVKVRVLWYKGCRVTDTCGDFKEDVGRHMHAEGVKARVP